MKVTCDSCGYVWDYNGRKKHNVTCPDCQSKVSLKKKKEKKKE